jgi:hypothetical protein
MKTAEHRVRPPLAYLPPFDPGHLLYDSPTVSFYFTRSAFVPFPMHSCLPSSYPPRAHPALQVSRNLRGPIPVAEDSKFFSREEDLGTQKSEARASAGAQQNATSTSKQDRSTPRRGSPRGNPSPARQVEATKIAPRVTTPLVFLFATHAVWERFASDSTGDFAISCDARTSGPRYGRNGAAGASLRDKSAASALRQPRRSRRAPRETSPLAHRGEENADRAARYNPISAFTRSLRTILELKQRPSKQDDFSDDDDDFAATFQSRARSERLPRPEQHFRHSSTARIGRVLPQRAFRVPAASRLQHEQTKQASAVQASKTTSPATRRHCARLERPVVFVAAASQQERELRQDFATAAFLRHCTWIASLDLSDVRDRTAIGHAAARDPAHRGYGSASAEGSGIGQDQRSEGTARIGIAFYAPSLQKRTSSSNYSDSRGAAGPMRGASQRTSDRSDGAATWSDPGKVAGQQRSQRQADTISHPTGRSSATQRPRLTGDSQKLSREEMIRQRHVSLRTAIQRHSDNVVTRSDLQCDATARAIPQINSATSCDS